MQTYNSFFFFFNDTATTEIYTLSLHDALPILEVYVKSCDKCQRREKPEGRNELHPIEVKEPFHIYFQDRKSTRLNSSHLVISYAVFCLKKKKLSYSISHSI